MDSLHRRLALVLALLLCVIADQGSTNAITEAYEAVLDRALDLPAEERRYIIIRTSGSWGSWVRALATGMQLAIALDRVLVLDSAFASVYGSQLVKPFSPWLITDAANDMAGLEDGDEGEVLVSLREAGRGDCWYVSHSLRDCAGVWRNSNGDGGGAPRLVLLSGPMDGGALVQTDTELRSALVSALPGILSRPSQSNENTGVDDDPTLRIELDSQTMTAVLPAPSKTLAATIERVRASLRWGDAQLRVGVHIRGTRAASSSFWSCIERHVQVAQAALSVSSEATLIVVTSDAAAARSRAKSALGDVGRVVWPAKAAARNGEAETSTDAIDDHEATLIDWWLLADTHLVVGAERSTFALTAAVRGGAPYASASMTRQANGGAARCGRLAPVHL